MTDKATITRIQKRLRELGLYSAALDGNAGPKTRAAVVAFQRCHGLKPDGIIGQLTLAALYPAPMPERDQDPVEAEPKGCPPTWPRQADVERFYGAPGARQTMLVLPYPMRLAWEPETIVRRFSVHEKVHDSAARCFERIADAYDECARADLGIDLFGGCLNVRKMRGGSRYSMHSWGIALDFDPDRNQLAWGRDRARLARPDAETFWRIWESAGWVSLGRARNMDWMHVQASRL